MRGVAGGIRKVMGPLFFETGGCACHGRSPLKAEAASAALLALMLIRHFPQ